MRCALLPVAFLAVFACGETPLGSYARFISSDADRAARAIERYTAADITALAHGNLLELRPGDPKPMSPDSLNRLTDASMAEISSVQDAFDELAVPAEVRDIHFKLVTALDSARKSLGRLRGTLSDCLNSIGDNYCIYAMRHSLDQVAAASGMYMKYRCELRDSLRQRQVVLPAYRSGKPGAGEC
jgi:hypothetical protein